MKKLITYLFLITFFIACAGGQFTNSSTTIKPTYVSPAMYMKFSCEELEMQAADLIAKVPQLENEIDKIKKDLTDEFISLVSKMSVGRKEFIEFKKLNKNK